MIEDLARWLTFALLVLMVIYYGRLVLRPRSADVLHLLPPTGTSV